MKVTTLLENNLAAGSTFIAKHGLSLYLETKGKKLLFDTGPDDSILENAKSLGVDLAAVDIVVVSHSHYDHGGGLESFLELNSQAKVYLSPYVLGEYYARRAEDKLEYIGINHEVLKKYAGRIEYIAEKTVISPGITLLPNTEHSTFKPSAVLFKKRDGVLVQDTYDHELIMVIEEKDESGQDVMHIFTGCSHNGVLNMVLSVKKEFPEQKIQTLIGGFHLMNTTAGGLNEEEATVLGIAAALLKYDIFRIYTGHCTGTDALAILQQVLGEKISGLWTGGSFTA